jgi:hypothetical protein
MYAPRLLVTLLSISLSLSFPASQHGVSTRDDASALGRLARYPFLCDFLAAQPDCFCECLLWACFSFGYPTVTSLYSEKRQDHGI